MVQERIVRCLFLVICLWKEKIGIRAASFLDMYGFANAAYSSCAGVSLWVRYNTALGREKMRY